MCDSSPFSIRTHNGTITVNNPATGNYRMFRVRTQAEKARFAAGERVVSVKDSSTDENWRAFGFVNDDGEVVVWKKFRGTVYDVYGRMLSNPVPFVEKGAVYQWEARCRVCNKELTTPESIETGIGPVCAKRRPKRQPMSHGRQMRQAALVI
jgi:hypothetical protein